MTNRYAPQRKGIGTMKGIKDMNGIMDKNMDAHDRMKRLEAMCGERDICGFCGHPGNLKNPKVCGGSGSPFLCNADKSPVFVAIKKPRGQPERLVCVCYVLCDCLGCGL